MDEFNFIYFKYKYESDLIYLFKIVHNKDMLDTLINEQESLNKFCMFVWNLNEKKDKVVSIESSVSKLEEKQIDEMIYIYNFLKKYDDMYLFKNLTLNILEDYLVSQ